MSTYDLYKPLRNYLRQFPLLESLAVVRAYAQHLQFGAGFAPDMDVNPAILNAKHKVDKKFFEWELDILARELVLNAPSHGIKTLRSWPAFAGAINRIKDLENEISRHHHEMISKNILLELYRIAHRQFPWQQAPSQSELLRSFKIFGAPTFEPILQDKLGLTAIELYTIGLAMSGHFLESFGFGLPARIEIPGLTLDSFERFVAHFSIDMNGLKKKTLESQSYDQDYAYTFNPLRRFPLVRVVLHGKDSLIAPIPTFLLRRFSEGVYYEICDANGFSAAFGPSYQAYVGEVIDVINTQRSFVLRGEQPYKIGKEQKDSVDWIVSAPDGHLFIECKTKKIRYGAKIGLALTEVLDEDLDKMASFIVQIYKTLVDALASNYPHWKPDDKPIYPLIVTLEEWYAFGDRILAAIDEAVVRRMGVSQLDPELLKKYPYSICSVADFEDALQIMGMVGIHKFMSKRLQGEQRLWSVSPFMLSSFANEFAKLKGNLFPDDIKKIHPQI